LNTPSQYSIAAIVVAFALLFGGLPIVLGGNTENSTPAFTLDICHPAQALDVVSAPCCLPIPMMRAVADELAEGGLVAPSVVAMATRAAEAPETPPPEPHS